jgi:UDP-2-acetamido-2,6-beta-L-arabino-hexul-4-ose reductase
VTSQSKIVAITGAHGALGRYASLHFRYRRGYEVIELDRAAYNDAQALRAAVGRADAVLHFAGINRAPDAEILAGNPALAQTLVGALDASGATPHVIYASSTHEARDNAYGRSKREAGDLLAAWASASGGRFTRLVLPHIYSELVRPNYNSGIATFCHAVATGGAPRLDVDAEITPLHASEVCSVIDGVLDEPTGLTVRPVGRPTRMSELLADITAMHDLYRGRLIVPDVRRPDQLHLFNTYRAHLYGEATAIPLALHADERGNLFEAVKELNGGQTFISTTRPGVTRGNHFHFHKVERFCVLRGEARIQMRRMSDNRQLNFDVTGDTPCFVDMPTLWTHNITNTGPGELLTLFWAHEIFDPAATDTYFVAV